MDGWADIEVYINGKMLVIFEDIGTKGAKLEEYGSSSRLSLLVNLEAGKKCHQAVYKVDYLFSFPPRQLLTDYS